VACVPSVTYGLGAIATSLQSKPKSNVVVSELNFPTNVYVWHSLKRKGNISEVRLLRAKDGTVPISDFEKAIDDNTVAVSLDYVSWINGCKHDIRAVADLAHAHGALMIVDAFHAIGVLPVDVRRLGADVLVSGTYKWLMGPHGTAFLYVRGDVLDRLQPSITGWHGISDSVIARITKGQPAFGRPFDLSQAVPADDATRFEWGTWAVVSVVGSSAAIEFTVKYPPEERWPLVLHLTDRLVDGLRKKGRQTSSPLEPEMRSGIVTFRDPNAPGLCKKLQAENLIVAPRVNTVRVSPHFFNRDDEIDALLDRL